MILSSKTLFKLPWIPDTMPGDNYELRAEVDAKLFNSRIKLAQFCKEKLQPSPIICEVGIFRGDFSSILLDIFNPKKFYLIDMSNFINNKFENKPQMKFLKGLSWEKLNELEDNSLDYIYIDADHSYDAIKKDIEAAHKKIKPEGIIQFNNYCTWDGKQPYGVLNAVNSYLENHKIKVIGMSLDRSGFHDLAIQKCL